MEGVSFEEEQAVTRSSSPRVTGLVGFLTATRFVENERQAISWLIATAVIAAVAAIGVWIYANDEPDLPPPQVVPGAPIPRR